MITIQYSALQDSHTHFFLVDGSYYNPAPAKYGPGYGGGRTARDGGRYSPSMPWQKQDPIESRTRSPLPLPAAEPMSEKEQMMSKLLQFLDSRKDAASLLNAFLTDGLDKKASSDSPSEA